jgi:hypothetical protein
MTARPIGGSGNIGKRVQNIWYSWQKAECRPWSNGCRPPEPLAQQRPRPVFNDIDGSVEAHRAARCRYRLRIEKPSRRQAGAVDRRIKNIEPVVVADNIVKLLRLDRAVQVDFGIGDALVVLQRLADKLPRRIDEDARRTRRVIDHVGDRAIAGNKKSGIALSI